MRQEEKTMWIETKKLNKKRLDEIIDETIEEEKRRDTDRQE